MGHNVVASAGQTVFFSSGLSRILLFGYVGDDGQHMRRTAGRQARFSCMVAAKRLLAGVALVAVGLGIGFLNSRSDRQSLDRRLAVEAHTRLDAIEEYFGRARDVLLLSAQNPSFEEFYEQLSGTHGEKLNGGSFQLDEANDALAYLVHLYPGSVGEVCFIDASGAENARLVRGVRAAPADLSLNEQSEAFFAPTMALGQGQVYQAKPYVSPDTLEWVVSNSTVIPGPIGANRR